MSEFAQRVIAWQREYGRHDLPWQATRDPYPVWISEVMLQQTQVTAVIPYFERFIARFPDLASLASADQDDVLALWSGLGYYARARNLHRAARIVVEQYGGAFPEEFEAIAALPGIGRSTAGAISVFVSGARQAILDGNVKRVLARCFGISGFPGNKLIEQRMWSLAVALLPEGDVGDYTQGLMDLGAAVCTRNRPHCEACPLGGECVALHENRVAELPSRRPGKPVPGKSTVMLILQRNGEILLEKRPESGIWGGLWSFPEVSDASQAETLSRGRFGATVKAEGALPVIRHGFTHFTLDITPALLRVMQTEPRAQSPGHVWLTVEDAIGAAVPAPVRTILHRLRDRDG